MCVRIWTIAFGQLLEGWSDSSRNFFFFEGRQPKEHHLCSNTQTLGIPSIPHRTPRALLQPVCAGWAQHWAGGLSPRDTESQKSDLNGWAQDMAPFPMRVSRASTSGWRHQAGPQLSILGISAHHVQGTVPVNWISFSSLGIISE